MMTEMMPDDRESDGEEQSQRRFFTLAYKRQIVEEYEATARGAQGAILRREGLNSTHIKEWRTAHALGELSAKRAESERVRRTGLKEQLAENERLQRENERLKRRLEQSQGALEIMGKAHALLASLAESAEQEQPPNES